LKWDEDEKIGDVFVSCFSKSLVLEIYSDFINNFNQAMELAKSESKRKSAFADFLKVKQITASDRLNFFWFDGQAYPEVSTVHPPPSGLA